MTACTPLSAAFKAAVEAVFGAVVEVTEEEWAQMSWMDEQDGVQFSGPILPKKECQVRIEFVEDATWTVKAGGAPGYEGQAFKAAKLTAVITDANIATEGDHIKPRLTVELQFNLEKYPYLDKKTGNVAWLGRQFVYDLEEAFGFEPVFVGPDGAKVEPYISKNGRKLAPKVDGVKRGINPEFAATYFNADGTVKPDNWIGKTVYADIGVEESEQWGARNKITRFRPAPVAV